MGNERKRVIILGSGPAGLTAAIYTARAGIRPLVIEGAAPGGQLMLTTMVENYPGFAEGIMGPDLMAAMRQQAERVGANFVTEDAVSVDLSQRPFSVTVQSGERYEGDALIIATGASAKMLGLPSEEALLGRGVSTCATCDGFFFKNKDVVVVGGGDTAMEEALYLADLTNSVTVIHRRDQLRASQIMQERAMANPKISFIWNTVVEEILDPEAKRVTAVRLRNVKSEEVTTHPTDGVFIAIGHEPNTGIFRGQLELDARGYIILKERTMTSVPGVFAAGDVHDHVYRQAVTAAGFGCMAAIDCERWLKMEG